MQIKLIRFDDYTWFLFNVIPYLKNKNPCVGVI